jgi:hypothetical protein
MIDDVVGIKDDEDLDIYTSCKDDDANDDALCNIRKRYKFPTTMDRVNLPGYSASNEYNEYNIFAYCDDNCRNSDAPLNPTADILLMTSKTSQKLRGNVLLIAYKGVHNAEVVPMSLRDIYWLIQHIYECGSKGCVPERVHFYNLQRSELANWLASKNAINVDLG